MRCRLQNHQKRRKLLGLAQYRREHAVNVLLENVLEEERRMRAYLGKKQSPVMTPEDLKKHRKQPTATSARRASSRTWFWTISLCTILILADIAAKATERVFKKPSDQLESWDSKEKQKPTKRQNRPTNGKNQRNMSVLRRAFAGKENAKTQWRTNATSQDGRTFRCLRISSKTSAGKVCLNK